MDGERIPDGYLELCSLDALESLVLARMNRSANVYTQMKQLLQRWVESEADVRLARWMLEKRRAQSLRTSSPAREFVEHALVGALGTATLAAPSRAVILPGLNSSHHSSSRRMELRLRTTEWATAASKENASGTYVAVQDPTEACAAAAPELAAGTSVQLFVPSHCDNRSSSADLSCVEILSQEPHATPDQISGTRFDRRSENSRGPLARRAAVVLPLSARYGSPHVVHALSRRMEHPLARELTTRLKLGEDPGVLRVARCQTTDSSLGKTYLAARLRTAS